MASSIVQHYRGEFSVNPKHIEKGGGGIEPCDANICKKKKCMRSQIIKHISLFDTAFSHDNYLNILFYLTKVEQNRDIALIKKMGILSHYDWGFGFGQSHREAAKKVPPLMARPLRGVVGKRRAIKKKITCRLKKFRWPFSSRGGGGDGMDISGGTFFVASHMNMFKWILIQIRHRTLILNGIGRE